VKAVCTVREETWGNGHDRHRALGLLSHYCTKTHAAAGQQAGLDTETTATINEGGLPNDDRLRPLVQATRRILGKRGWLSDVDESEFEDLGLGRPEFYEIIALVGIKTMSNYVNHIAETKLDEPFRQ